MLEDNIRDSASAEECHRIWQSMEATEEWELQQQQDQNNNKQQQ
jgi:hypothetical protein